MRSTETLSSRIRLAAMRWTPAAYANWRLDVRMTGSVAVADAGLLKRNSTIHPSLRPLQVLQATVCSSQAGWRARMAWTPGCAFASAIARAASGPAGVVSKA